MPHEEHTADLAVPLAAERPVGPGILVFSSSVQELFRNVAAQYFLKRLRKEEQGHITGDAFPEVIAQLLNQMRQVLDRRRTDKEPGRVEATRLVAGRDVPVLLQTFGLSDHSEPSRSRIVITMEEIRTPVKAKPHVPVPPAT